MDLKTLIKLIAGLIVLTILTVTLIIVNRYYGDHNETRNASVKQIESLAPDKEDDAEIVEVEDIRRRIKRDDQPEIILGAPALKKAQSVLNDQKFAEAKVLLEGIVADYEDTPAETEAYRILGEMNLDELFEVKESDPRYIHYKVKGGDTYFEIIRRHQTNFDLLMLLNNLTTRDSSKLRAGQKLVLMPLNLSLRIVPHKNQLFLLDEKGNVLKMYEPYIDMTIPKMEGIVSTQISKRQAIFNGRKVNATRGNYREAEKEFFILNPKITIRSQDGSIPERFKGIILTKEDMEELALLMRQGNKVEITY